jgi:uncharacterized NAD-dependent epimerase/dehydratase family protein
MNRNLAETLAEALEEKGCSARVRGGYSGRGMLGEQTTAIVVEDFCGEADIISAVIENAEIFVEEGESKYPRANLRMDAMGKGLVIY